MRRQLLLIGLLVAILFTIVIPSASPRPTPAPGGGISLITPRELRAGDSYCSSVTTSDILNSVPALNVTDLLKNLPQVPSKPLNLNDYAISINRGPAQPASGLISGVIPEDIQNIEVLLGPANRPLIDWQNQPLAKSGTPIEVLKAPNTAIYGNNANAGVVNFITKPGDYSLSPILQPGQVGIIRGPFDGNCSDTRVSVNDQPAKLLAESPYGLFWEVPPTMTTGSATVIFQDGPNGASFPVFILGIAMTAEKLHLLRGESTRFNATVFGPEQLPDSAWTSAVAPENISADDLRRLASDFNPPKPGEPGALFFRLENISSAIVTMSPANKGEAFTRTLTKNDFKSGPFKHDGVIRSKQTGSFTINGLVVAYLNPTRGAPLTPGTITRPGASTPGTTGSGAGPGTATQPGTQPPRDDPRDVSTPPACQTRALDGWLSPSQGVWQDDTDFEDRVGKQISRLEDSSRIVYHAEINMVANRDAVLTGLHHYQKSGKKVVVESRNFIILKGESDCSRSVPVRLRFTITGPGGPFTFNGENTYQIPFEGQKQQSSQGFQIREAAVEGFPATSTFKFTGAGSYNVKAELIRIDTGAPTGLEMSVHGMVSTTQGPVVNFLPIRLGSSTNPDQLQETTEQLSKSSAMYVPDFYPLAPGGLPTQVLGLRNFTEDSIPAISGGLFGSASYYRSEKLLTRIEETVTASAFLQGAGRVMAVLDEPDFRTIEGQDTAAATFARGIKPARSSLTFSWKVTFLHTKATIKNVAHELVHTLPNGWADDEMLAECGLDYHNKEKPVANGIRLLRGGALGERLIKNHVTPIMDSTGGLQESLDIPLRKEDLKPHKYKDDTTGEEKEWNYEQIWITQCTYRHLLLMLSGAPPDPPMLLVRGLIGRRGKLEAEFLPFYDLMGYSDLTEGPAKDFAIVLKDGAGKTLGTFPFLPAWTDFEGTFKRDLVSFTYRVPLLPNLAQIDLVGPGSAVLSSKKLTIAPPTLQVTSPTAGATITPSAGRVRVTWTASSSTPGARLLFTVLYSSNEGRTFDEQTLEAATTSFDVALSRGVKSHVVKIIATDGSRSSEATVRFTTP